MALVSRKCIAQVILLVAFWITFSDAKNIVIGLLGDFSGITQNDQQNYKIFPETTEDDLAYESSNWILDGPHDLSKIFHAVKQKFRQISNRATVSFTFRQISFSSGASLNSVISLLYENKDTCDAFVFGFFAENRLQAFYKSRKLLCNAVNALVTELNIATFSWSCFYKQHFSNVSSMLSLLPGESTIGKSVTSTLHHHKWRKVAFLTTSWPDEWNDVCNEIEHQIMGSNYFSVQYYKRFTKQTLSGPSNSTHFKVMWTQLRQASVSAVVVCVPHELNYQSERTFLDKLLGSAYEVDAEHAQTRAFLLVDWKGIQKEQIIRHKPSVVSFSKSRRSTPTNTKVYSSSIKLSRVIGHTNVSKEARSNNAYEESIQRFQPDLLQTLPWKNHLSLSKRSVNNDTEQVEVDDQTIPFEIEYENVLTISPSLPQQSFSIETNNVTEMDYLYFMDSILLTMTALSKANTLLGNKGMENGRFVVEKASELRIANGFTGAVWYDHSKQRGINFTVWDIVQTNGVEAIPVMTIDTSSEKTGYYKAFSLREIVWSPNGHPVSDTCETLSFLCHVTSIGLQTQDLVVALFCGTGLYMMIYGAYIFLRKKKEWQILLRGPNKLFLNDGDLKFLTSSNNRQLAADSSREANPHASRIGSLITLADQNLMNQDNSLAMLKGDYVFLKKICALPCELKKASHDSLRQIKELRHENLCVVHGLYSSPSFHFLVTEYGHRRSLKELIENRDCELNWTFKVSLLHDLVRGMKYLHSSPIHCHGRLKSRNCAVDGRFVLKITDYGVNRLRNSMGINTEVETDPKDLLWTAPELLNDPALRQIGTQKGDSYSFAIICQELILREDPFSMINLSADEIIEKLKKPPPLLRPSVQADAAPIEIIQIMKQCWQEQPELRLTFSAVHSEIKRMNRGKKHNIVEDMMKQLEDYSSHLEELVNERTAELKEEKKKTEQLLMRMLPPSVAKLLMANQKIIPETFDHCTIYFSDICGFTTIAHASSPMQVVDFLNDLYTCFDAIIERYEIYKVETIGDAYMVSSGIPKVIGDRHAEEAALMALDIMSATTTFRIRHLPDVDVRIRIGMHSGPAVAGVVGLTMPRYCLFGDTINTASRLETTGIPSRIHISSDTKEVLDKSTKEFTLQKRGTIELKGRGKMETWWLLGMKGFTKPLPNPGDINAPNHGIKIDKPTSSENQSSNNSKGCLYMTDSTTEKRDTCKNVSTLAQRTSRTIRSGGSSFVVATPLALIPEVTLKPRFDWLQVKASDNKVSPRKNATTHKVRRCQVATVMNRKKSIAPSCLYSPPPNP